VSRESTVIRATSDDGAQETPPIERQGVANESHGGEAPTAPATTGDSPMTTLETIPAIRGFLEIQQRVVLRATRDMNNAFLDGWKAGELFLIRELLARLPRN